MVLPKNTNNANNQQHVPAPRILGGAAPVVIERPRVSFDVRVDANVNPNGTVDVSFRIPANIIPGISENLNISLGNSITGHGQSQPRSHGCRSVSTTATAGPTGNRHATAKKRTYYTREQREFAIGLLNGGMPCQVSGMSSSTNRRLLEDTFDKRMQQQQVPRSTTKEAAKAKVNQDEEKLRKNIRDIAPADYEKLQYHSLCEGVSISDVPPAYPSQGDKKCTANWILQLEPESRTVPDCASSGYRVNLLKGSAKLTLFGTTSTKNVVEKLRIGHTHFIHKNDVFNFETTGITVCFIWMIESTSAGKECDRKCKREEVRNGSTI